MSQTTKSWQNDWIVTYDLENAENVSKNAIAKASNNEFKTSVKWKNDNSNYELPSTVLWAKRDTFADAEAVKTAFYHVFDEVKGSNKSKIKRLIICDYANDQIYIENN